MDILNLFLLGEDTIDSVKQIRSDALASVSTGGVVEWSSDSVSVKKVLHLPIQDIIRECNYFLRMYDPVIAAANPIYTSTKPFLLFS